MILNFITWNVDPVFINLGSLTIRWYGLLWALGIWLALVIVQKLFKHEKLPEQWIDKMFMYTVIGTIVGARLGHCFFYEWRLLPEPVTFLGITFKYGNHYLSVITSYSIHYTKLYEYKTFVRYVLVEKIQCNQNPYCASVTGQT